MNTIFITILIIVIIGISLYERCEYFADTNNKNPFFTKIPNIFYTKQFTDNLFIPPKFCWTPFINPSKNLSRGNSLSDVVYLTIKSDI